MRILLFLLLSSLFFACSNNDEREELENFNRPNIIMAMSDNQSYPHAGAYGDRSVNTPGFDYIAREGILFNNAFVSSPGCAPSRASILLGRYPWENEEAGGHQSLYPEKFIPFTDILMEAGYHVGFTGKGCAPFNWKQGGRAYDPAGPEYNHIRYEGTDLSNLPKDDVPDPEAFASNISTVDYFGNFRQFLSGRKDGEPFFFWYGAREPHTPFEEGSGLKDGKKLEDVVVPKFLPNTDQVKSDLLDYAYEIDWFDSHLVKMIELLREKGELENTIIIVTSDNGMQFPRAIGSCYEYGLHVPLAISWPAKVQKGQICDELINLTSIAPTLMEVTGTSKEEMLPMSLESFADILFSGESDGRKSSGEAVYAGRERHSSARWMNLGYPQRSIRTKEYLYIWNVYPERWPAGAPQSLNPENPEDLNDMYGIDEEGHFTGTAFYDIDNGVTKTYLMENKDDPNIKPYFDLAVGKRPADELFNIKNDPYCLNNLSQNPDYSDELTYLKNKLKVRLTETKDPRLVGPNPDIFENYQRFYIIRSFPKPDWVKR